MAAAFTVSLERMVRAAERMLSPHELTTVVVHSRNGIVASSLAERAPERIARTIYIASYMLPNHKRVLDYLPDKHSLISRRIDVNRMTLSDWLQPEIYRDGLYADCDMQDIALAQALLVREPIRPALTRLALSEQRYGRVPRAYIRLTQDQAVSLTLQDRLLNETSVDEVISLDTSHSAYFSQPDALTQAILKLGMLS
jgi:pimeloyl-ACP methyl ester carboxylesterase